MRPADVPPGPLLIDTDVFSYWYRQSGPWKEFGDLVAGQPLAMSFASRGEALAPTFKPGGPASLATTVRNALRGFVVLPYTVDVVERYAQIAIPLRESLKGKGVNDLWTAACALAYGTPLVTNNLSDFTKVRTAFPQLVLIHPDL